MLKKTDKGLVYLDRLLAGSRESIPLVDKPIRKTANQHRILPQQTGQRAAPACQTNVYISS